MGTHFVCLHLAYLHDFAANDRLESAEIVRQIRQRVLASAAQHGAAVPAEQLERRFVVYKYTLTLTNSARYQRFVRAISDAHPGCNCYDFT